MFCNDGLVIDFVNGSLYVKEMMSLLYVVSNEMKERFPDVFRFKPIESMVDCYVMLCYVIRELKTKIR